MVMWDGMGAVENGKRESLGWVLVCGSGMGERGGFSTPFGEYSPVCI